MCDKSDHFCFVCGLFIDKQHRVKLENNKAVIEAFKLLFNRSFNAGLWYEPQSVCSRCASALKKWKSGECDEQCLPFSIPMVWHRQIYHKPEDCYFCQTNVVGHHYKTRDRIKYANVLTVSKPVPKKCQDKQIVTKEVEDPDEFSDENSHDKENDKPFVPVKVISTERHLVSNVDYQDLVRDLGLSSRQTEILGSRLKQWNLVGSDFKVTFARDKDLTSFEQIFKTDDVDNKLVYCTDVDELFMCLNHEHRPQDWRLFLDGSSRSEYFSRQHNSLG